MRKNDLNPARCLECGIPIRDRTQSVEDFPNTIQSNGYGCCSTCYSQMYSNSLFYLYLDTIKDISKDSSFSSSLWLAACNFEDPTVWDYDNHNTKAWDVVKYARWVCEGCPIRGLCLEDAIEVEKEKPLKYISTIRGGLLPDQRRALIKKLRKENRETRLCTGSKEIS